LVCAKKQHGVRPCSHVALAGHGTFFQKKPMPQARTFIFGWRSQ
jgi:hypothetical protein